MKAVTVLGFVLVLLGIIGLFAGGLIFTPHRIERGLGPLRLEHQEMHSVPLPPVFSVIILLSGVGLVMMGVQRR
jgi:hypothetical protein